MHAMPATELWKFSPWFDAPRREGLSAFSDFAQVVALIAKSIQGVYLEPCNGREPELQACVQPVFTLDVSEETFDAFFNSTAGYRACYLQDANLGLIANLLLVEAVVERLCDTARYLCIADLSSIDIRTSLLATSCKAWVREDEFPFQSLTTDLAVEAWTKAAASGEQKAKWGLCAP